MPVGEDGSYTVLLGSAGSNGLPQSVFVGGVARWLGVRVYGAAESERVLLASVPYAMKSADAFREEWEGPNLRRPGGRKQQRQRTSPTKAQDPIRATREPCSLLPNFLSLNCR